MVGAVAACDSDNSDPPTAPITTAPATSTTSPSAALTLDDLQGALDVVLASTNAGPGVQGVQVGYIQEHLAAAVWFSTLPSGDWVVYQRVDQGVRESGFWMDGESEPPHIGERVRTTAWVRTADMVYEASMSAGSDKGWTKTAIPADAPLSVGQAILTGIVPGSVGYTDHVVSFQADDDGGAQWTLETPYLDGISVQRWTIASNGHLSSYSMRLVDVTVPPEAFDPSTSVQITFTVISSEAPISAPSIGAGLESFSGFDLPTDFPLGASST